jgi:hypothetical protein
MLQYPSLAKIIKHSPAERVFDVHWYFYGGAEKNFEEPLSNRYPGGLVPSTSGIQPGRVVV